jgi:hypothetical protein
MARTEQEIVQPNGGGGGAPASIAYKADNYTGILAAAPAPALNELAYARNSEGTSWLPWTIGGTYYPSGFYWFDGVNWVSDRAAIAEQLQININDIDAIELSLAGKVDSVQGGTDISLDNSDPNNPVLNYTGSAGDADMTDISASKGLFIQNVITAATLTGTVNNWNPTGFGSDTDMIRVNVSANNRVITGVVAPLVGVNRILAIKNINTFSDDLRFNHNDVGSSPANRFLCRDNNNRRLQPNQTALWFYDHIVQRWTPFNRIG